MTTYRVFDKQTGELQFEVFSAREFIDVARGATVEEVAKVTVTSVYRNGKEKIIDPLAEVDRLQTLENAKRERFESTHRRVAVKTGVTQFSKPRIFWVKK